MSNPDNPPVGTCIRCDAEREGHSYLLLYGDWDADRDGFSRPPITRPLCRSCWNERYDRLAGAYYEVDDVQRLWDILRAANGDLVADLKHMFVGGRPFVRVVDGELQGATTKPKDVGDKTIRFDPEMVDVDRDWLFEVFGEDDELPDREYPTIAIIRPVEETPFEDVRERGGDSHKISRWSK
ncbi:virus protein phiCh1-VP78 (plasmid) [Natrialba magadii ATCC 43099]|uniref:Virus protein phiCh1-VP78 n=3 Tax=root TaxID=1 RepID=D3T2D0_NATMM|nr:hypothetical protein [Natrialba magadii]YP_010078104.1 uncharacterized protein KMC42_gp74 [Natrialba phage PhiCh1]ADD07739.1 virus protein phiCh1-VP78 [Natrialba magadii ATCC 43099]ELY22986.1 hypothetical protein C500_21020 [Natrialba magadii ATCC 43099]QBJ01255.1 uncharacterized protein PhiCh1_365 [Natrialba phage PhiCh1]